MKKMSGIYRWKILLNDNESAERVRKQQLPLRMQFNDNQ